MRKIKPYILKLLIVFILSYIFLNIINIGFNLKNLFMDSKMAELFQISAIGYPVYVNAPWWYLSCMFLIMFSLYPFVTKHKTNFAYYFSPLLIVLAAAIARFANIDLNQHSTTHFFLMDGLYVGVIYMNIGIIAYNLSRYIREKFNDKKITRSMITIFEILGYSFVLLNCWKKFSGNVFIAIVLFVTVSLSFSNKSYTTSLFKSKIWKHLADFGFVMYLSHWAVRTFFLNHNIAGNMKYINRITIYLLTCICVAFIVVIIEKTIIFLYNKFLKSKLKKAFLK